MRMTARKLQPFGTTIFSEMTRLAIEHGAVNLAQGFPDFEGPAELREWAVEALRGGDNQYARSQGHPELVRAVAGHQSRHHGLDYEPMTEVGVYSGATEGIAAALLGLLDPGDEVILFEPYYDSYPACLALAGALPRFLTLRFPDFTIDFDELERLVGPRTRAILVNSPHNPTGKVLEGEEQEALARFARAHDLIVIADEVYEHLWYEGHRHRPIAALEGMRERTLTISSAGKTWSYTGWKIGWATGPRALVAGAQAAHQFLTFATATPLQRAVARALDEIGDDFYRELRADYDARRRRLASGLEKVGFRLAPCAGTYFITADFSALDEGDDRDFALRLIREAGVAAIPPSVFYTRDPEAGRKLLRFAFCKRDQTIDAALDRLERHFS
ncbi:MAG: aminotransferase class I/II-fold pyridoxal phosphate-dependent enzyme [Planctomycetes bacterium]|nr:aminotransferase class I/II-fold pyridoxal phosphate-dependent enzyme [Planctomycetota bacterium]